jgi:hypothetical protein
MEVQKAEDGSEEKVTLRTDPRSWTIHARGALLESGNSASADPAKVAAGFCQRMREHD